MVMESCLDIRVNRIGDALNFAAKRQGNSPIIAADRIGEGMVLKAGKVGNGVRYHVQRASEALSFRCGLVCSINDNRRLEVQEGTIWLMPENDFSQDVVVYANVTWRIE